jgi:hypothetical protein
MVLVEVLLMKMLLVVEVVPVVPVVMVLMIALVVLVEMEQKYLVGVFHHLMEHQVLHPVDSLLVEVVEQPLLIRHSQLVLVDMVVVVTEQRKLFLEKVELQTLVAVVVVETLLVLLVLVLMVLLLLDGQYKLNN